MGPRSPDGLCFPSGQSCWAATVTMTFWPSCIVCGRRSRWVVTQAPAEVQSGRGQAGRPPAGPAPTQTPLCTCHLLNTVSCPPHGCGGLPAGQLTPPLP